MTNNDNSKRNHSIGLIFSISLHACLFLFITYVSVDYIMPTGTVSTDEFVFNSQPIPLGDQTTFQEVEVLSANSSSASAKAKAAASTNDNSNNDILESEKSDVAMKTKKKKPKKKVPPKKAKPRAIPQEEEEVEENEIEADDTEDLLAKLEKEDNNKNRKEDLKDNFSEKSLSNDSLADLADENADQPAAPQQAYGASDGDRNARELKAVPGNVKPEYPMIARLRKISGRSILRFYVMPNGQVGEVQLKQSSGYDFFDNSAIAAKKRHKYYPGKVGWFEEAINFNVRGQEVELPSRLRRKTQ